MTISSPFVFETLEGLKENIGCTKEDTPYILLIIAQELRNIRELKEKEVLGGVEQC